MQNGRVCKSMHALIDTETRYVQIEKEMLAIVFSLECFNQYTFGQHVNVQSDHKLLETILQKPLSQAPRCRHVNHPVSSGTPVLAALEKQTNLECVRN